jgi:hypothetical protein
VVFRFRIDYNKFMKKTFIISGLSVLLALAIFDLFIQIWGSYLIYQSGGAAVSFYIFSYTIRNTIFRNNKKKRVWIYSAAILFILAPPMAGIGGANGGPFDIESALLQYYVGFIYILIFSLYTLIGNSSVKSTDYGEEHKDTMSRIFLIAISIITYGFMLFGAIMSISTLQSNGNLFI